MPNRREPATRRTCDVGGCARPHKAKGLCSTHYYPVYRAMISQYACAVEGCTNGQYQTGLCHSHYWRASTYGDPLAGGTPNGALLRWLRQVIPSAGPEDCILSPFHGDSGGYGGVVLDGRRLRMHQAALLLSGHELPAEGMHTRHLCGKPACVNPFHLRAGTPGENGSDTIRHGTAQRAAARRALLTEEDVALIRSERRTDHDWAEHFGVGDHVIRAARTGRTWGQVATPPVEPCSYGSLTEADVRLIRTGQRSDRDWAKHLGVSAVTVWQARTGRTWKHVR